MAADNKSGETNNADESFEAIKKLIDEEVRKEKNKRSLSLVEENRLRRELFKNFYLEQVRKERQENLRRMQAINRERNPELFRFFKKYNQFEYAPGLADMFGDTGDEEDKKIEAIEKETLKKLKEASKPEKRGKMVSSEEKQRRKLLQSAARRQMENLGPRGSFKEYAQQDERESAHAEAVGMDAEMTRQARQRAETQAYEEEARRNAARQEEEQEEEAEEESASASQQPSNWRRFRRGADTAANNLNYHANRIHGGLGRVRRRVNRVWGQRSSLLFFIVVIILHFLDLRLIKMARYSDNIFYFYLFIAFWAYFGVLKDPRIAWWESFRVRDLIMAFGISAIAYTISWWAGYLTDAFPNSVWIKFAIIVLPIWPLTIFLRNPQGSRWIKIIGAWWLTALLILVIIFFIISVRGPASMGWTHGTVDLSGVFPQVWASLKDRGGHLWSSLISFRSDIRNLYNRTLYEEKYIGTVEDTQTRDLGIYVEYFKPTTATRFFIHEPIHFSALVRGDTFVEDDVPILKSDCYYTDNNGTKFYHEEVIPEQREVRFMEPFFVSCTMPASIFSKKGLYTITYRGVYNFDTWAYSTWIFVDENTRLSYIRQGQDINQELDLPKKSTTFFTKGPVNIGMSDELEQPISINSKEPGKTYIQLIVGVSSIDPDTVIQRINNFTILTPKAIKLKNCGEEPSVKDFSNEEYNLYTFDISRVHNYTKAVDCWLDIEDAAALLGADKVAYKTFVVDTNYIAQVEKSYTVNVEDQLS